MFLKSLEIAESIYNTVPSKVLFLYRCFQQSYLETREILGGKGINIEFIQASELTENDLKEISESTKGQIIIAIDDSTITSSKSASLAQIFCTARHYRCSIVLFWHTLFANTAESRIISQNTSYFFLLNSPRLLYQIGSLGSQLNVRKTLLEAYKTVCEKPYGYVCLDVSVACPAFLRIRTKIMGESPIQTVFIPSL